MVSVAMDGRIAGRGGGLRLVVWVHGAPLSVLVSLGRDPDAAMCRVHHPMRGGLLRVMVDDHNLHLKFPLESGQQ